MKPEEMKPEEMQPQPEMQFKPEMQPEPKMQPQPKPEMQPQVQPPPKPPVSDVKSKRQKRSASDMKPIRQKLSASDVKPIRQKRSASETVEPNTDLKQCKPEPITLNNLPVMIQMNGQKYVKLMKHQDQVVVNMRIYITYQSSGKLHPIKKGIILSLKDWQSLKKEVKTVNQLLQQLSI